MSDKERTWVERPGGETKLGERGTHLTPIVQTPVSAPASPAATTANPASDDSSGGSSEK